MKTSVPKIALPIIACFALACAPALFEPSEDGITFISLPPDEFRVGPMTFGVMGEQESFQVQFGSNSTWRITKVEGSKGGIQTVRVRIGTTSYVVFREEDATDFCVNDTDTFRFGVTSSGILVEQIYVTLKKQSVSCADGAMVIAD